MGRWGSKVLNFLVKIHIQLFLLQTSRNVVKHILRKGKVLHFFRLQAPNPLPMLSFCIGGLFPIGARLEHLHCIGSIDRGYRHDNAVQIGDNALPIQCQWRIKFQLAEKNQSRKIEFKSLPSEGRCNANPAELQNLSEAIFGYQWSANCLPIECQWSASRLVIPNDCNGMPIDYQWILF